MISVTRFRPHTRPAFTLVEMMVSTALIMFIMYIIAAAFEKGIEAFRVMKTAGDMQERMRSASVLLRQDLTRQHFGNHWLLSDQRLDQSDWRMPGSQSDEGGYFRIYQTNESLTPSLTTTVEGQDPDFPSLLVTRSTAAKHVLQFTIRLRPDEYRRDLFFSTDTGGTGTDALGNFSVPDYMRPSSADDPTTRDALSKVLASRWAEVAYFLRETGQFAGNNKLYGLYRRQKLLVEPTVPPSETVARMPNVAPSFALQPALADVSFWLQNATTLKINGPKDVSVPGRRFGVQPGGSDWFVGRYAFNAFGPDLKNIGVEFGDSSPLTGGDLLLSDVVSFEVKVMWDIPADRNLFRVKARANDPDIDSSKPSVYPPEQFPSAPNADYPFDYLPWGANPSFSGTRVFDTWSKETSGTDYDFVGDPNAPNWNKGYFVLNPIPARDNSPTDSRTIPLRVRVRAVQIKLRIWDVKSQQTRQITIIQDL